MDVSRACGPGGLSSPCRGGETEPGVGRDRLGPLPPLSSVARSLVPLEELGCRHASLWLRQRPAVLAPSYFKLRGLVSRANISLHVLGGVPVGRKKGLLEMSCQAVKCSVTSLSPGLGRALRLGFCPEGAFMGKNGDSGGFKNGSAARRIDRQMDGGRERGRQTEMDEVALVAQRVMEGQGPSRRESSWAWEQGTGQPVWSRASCRGGNQRERELTASLQNCHPKFMSLHCVG